MQRLAFGVRRSLQTSVRGFSTEGAAAAKNENLVLRLSSPTASLVAGKEVKLVTVPGADGVYAVGRNAPPMLSELKPGVVSIEYLDGQKEKFFIPGGFAFTNRDNTLEISTPEGVSMDDIDVDALKSEVAAAKSKLAAAEKGSREEAEARLALRLYKTMGFALKVQI